MSSIMRCRSGLMALSVMRDAPALMEVANPLISRQDALTRYPIGRIVRRCALPRERFSPMGDKRTWRSHLAGSIKASLAVLTDVPPSLDDGAAVASDLD